MDKEQKMRLVMQRLETRYPEAVCSLEHTAPLELMISTQLSAQCTDKRVNMVTKDLFKKYKTIDDYADADIAELENDIRPTGFYRNKARNIKRMAIKLREKYNYVFPDSLDELMKLDGVGRKTGNLFLGEIKGIPGIVVDTHVGRISRRLGFTENDDPAKTEKDLQKITAVENWIKLGHLFILFGREICSARKPDCEKCFLNDICRYYSDKKKAPSLCPHS